MHIPNHRCLWLCILFVALSSFSGCGSYVLQGKVVRGESSSIQLVMPGDERLTAAAVANVDVRIVRDPNSANRHQVGQARSNPSGDFNVVMSAFGTGWMEEQWLVQGVAPGFENAQTIMNLPSKNSKWRVLITLSPGVSTPLLDDDLMQDLEKFQ